MSKFLRDSLESAKKTDEFWMDSAKLDFALKLENKRRISGKSYKDIAISLNTSAAYVSKVFRGDANLTIESMAKLARCVGTSLTIDLKVNTHSEGDSEEVCSLGKTMIVDQFLEKIRKSQISWESIDLSNVMQSSNDKTFSEDSKEYLIVQYAA